MKNVRNGIVQGNKEKQNFREERDYQAVWVMKWLVVIFVMAITLSAEDISLKKIRIEK